MVTMVTSGISLTFSAAGFHSLAKLFELNFDVGKTLF